MPSRVHFSQSVVPALCKRVQDAVVQESSTALAVVLTPNGWTSKATESHLTVTARYITPYWKMKSLVLQTCPIYEQHTSREKPKDVVPEWKLERPRTSIAVTTNNAKNIVHAVCETGLGPQVGCFAHSINLAQQKATASQVSRLLYPQQHNCGTHFGEQAGDTKCTKTPQS